MSNTWLMVLGSGLLSVLHLGLLFLVARGAQRHGYKNGARDAAKAIQSQINEAYQSHQAKQASS